MNTVNREISLHEIFVVKIFVLKIFRRVDVLRKYFNTKVFTTEVGKNARREYLSWKSFSKEIACAATTYIKSMGGDGWRVADVRESPKTSDRYAVAVKNE